MNEQRLAVIELALHTLELLVAEQHQERASVIVTLAHAALKSESDLDWDSAILMIEPNPAFRAALAD